MKTTSKKKYDYVLKYIGNNIKEYRQKKDMKGDTLGRALGLTKSAVSQMEHGLTDFKISTLCEMATLFEVDVYSLIVLETVHLEKQILNMTSEKGVLINTAIVNKLFNEIDSLHKEITILNGAK